MATKLDLFGTNASERFPKTGSAKLVNMYLETTEDTGVVAFQRTGYTEWLNMGETPIRGIRAINSKLYFIHLDNLYVCSTDKSTINLGKVDTSSGRVAMTDNGTQLFIATSGSGYILTLATNTLVTITAAGYPKGTTAQFNAGFFLAVKPNSMQFYVSSLYDGTAWDALDFASAESNPDDLVTCVINNGLAIMFGTQTTEFWSNNGNGSFPYAPSGLTAEWGLAARWSISKFDSSLVYLARNSLGEVQIVRLDGYKPTRISSTAIEAIVNSFSEVTDAVGLSYLHAGHPFYQITFPTVARTFCYDGLTNLWSEITSFGLTRSVVDQAITWEGITYFLDYRKAIIYQLDSTASKDGSLPIIGSIISKQLKPSNDTFSVNSIKVEFAAGLIASNTENPQIGLSVSKDGGNTWGNTVFRPMGKVGEYLTSAKWTRLGAGRMFTFKISISDAVDKAIIAAYVE